MAYESGDANFVSKLDEEGKKKAKEELNELNDKDCLIAVKTFRQWVMEQNWLKTPTDFAFLLRFLRVRKFSQLGARETLENYWTGKANSPEWFRNVNPADEIIYEILNTGWCKLYCYPNNLTGKQHDIQLNCFQCPMKYDKMGRRVVLFNLSVLTHDLVKRWRNEHFRKTLFLVYDWLLLDERVQVYGLVFIIDFSGMTLPLLMATNSAETSRKSTPLYQKALPMRLKAIHMYNEPTFIDVFMALFNPFMRQKIKDRIIVHGKSLVKIYEEVGMEVLPNEYLPDEYKGPSAGSAKKIIDDMLEDMMKPEFREYIKDLSSDKYGVDIEKRKTDDDPVASFRKLEVS